MRSPRAVLTIAACLLASGCGGDPRDAIEPIEAARADGTRESFALTRVATGLNRPTYVGAAPGDVRGLWVLEQPGRVVRLAGKRRQVVVDLADEVKVGAEQGLLGLAFHPDFATNRRLYLHFSDKRGDTRVEELTLRRDREPRRRELLFLDQPEDNHNGGQLAFGPDGRLYLGLGDGGGAFDPSQNAQNLDSLLGKIVAADVDSGEGEPDWDIVFYGLRNPWRFWIDSGLNEIWIGDVGQDRVEEIDRTRFEFDEPPKNFGWAAFEGSQRLDRERGIHGPGELIWPVAAYEHGEGGHCSVTAGLVYRGSRAPRLTGRYVYGDFCSGTLWSLEPVPGGDVRDVRVETAKVPQITHIGTDSRGELVFASGSGDIFRAGPTP